MARLVTVPAHADRCPVCLEAYNVRTEWSRTWTCDHAYAQTVSIVAVVVGVHVGLVFCVCALDVFGPPSSGANWSVATAAAYALIMASLTMWLYLLHGAVRVQRARVGHACCCIAEVRPVRKVVRLHSSDRVVGGADGEGG